MDGATTYKNLLENIGIKIKINYVACYVTSQNMEKYIRKVTRVGKRSLSINIPAEIVDQLKLKEKQKLTITTKGRSIVIKDWK